MSDNAKRITNDGESPVVSYLHAKAKKLGVPAAVTFEITSRCNFECKMCYVHDKTDCGKNELSAEQWLSLGRQARDSGALFLLLTGGEPLVRSDFEQIYTGLSEMGFVISINTNGSLLSGKTAELFKKLPPNRLNISLYGVSDNTYREVTGRAAFESVKNNILDMRASGIDCRINCSLTPLNAAEINGIFDFAKQNDLFIKATSYMYPPVRRACFEAGKSDCRFTADETAFYRREIHKLNLSPEAYAQKCRLLLQNGGQENCGCDEEADEGSPIMCRAGSSSCWIDKNGLMSACGLFAQNKFGAIEFGFAGAWEKVRESTAKIRLSPKCTACGKKSLCGVCAAAAYSETGSFDGTPEYLCKVADKLYEYIKADCEKLNTEK